MKMYFKNNLIMLSALTYLLVIVAVTVTAQHEDIPYQNVENICETCVCLSYENTKPKHYQLSCATKNFQHILAKWPNEFGFDHNGVDIVAIFSGNTIETLQQLPATNASLYFSCRHCGIKYLQAPLFYDTPNIIRLDLSWNNIVSDELSALVFRGPFRNKLYEPIGLQELDLSHNQLTILEKNLFEHTPKLKKLSLSHNQLEPLNTTALKALVTLKSLISLDLSYAGLKTVPADLFEGFDYLETLNLAGNYLLEPPSDLSVLGQTLLNLNLAGNIFELLNGEDLIGLNKLQHLNISDMSTLRTIEERTFAPLYALEYLYCSHNVALEKFDLESLQKCKNLTLLDISYCDIETLDLDSLPNSSSNLSAISPWPQLHSFRLEGNPWICDCKLFQILDYTGVGHDQQPELEVRCEGPYFLSGKRFSNMTTEEICNMKFTKNYKAVEEDPPRFLRKRYIILTAITASVVVALGLIIGFLVVCIRRRLKREDYGVEPIRYTSVRRSNLSAFMPPTQTNRDSQVVG